MIQEFQNKKPKLAPDVFVAPNAMVIGDVDIREGSSIWYGAVVRGDVHYIRIGRKTNIQDNSVIHVTSGVYPTIIGDEVTAGHRVILHGCHIHHRALIGMGSVILDGAEIGEEAFIGAGSLVVPGTKIPPRVLALGSPCKIKRDLKKEEILSLKESAQHYSGLAQLYRLPS